MTLRLIRLTLTDFRSYPAATLDTAAPMLVLTGPNGAGKTNLLEAISLLGPGRGLRGARVAELARAGGPAWAVAGRFEGAWGEFEIGTGTPPEGPTERRVFRLDGAPARTQAELAERMTCVWLTPQMDRLFQEGASGRRRFLDRLAWALEPGHAREVAAYDNAMAQRNRILAQNGDPAWLAGLEDAMARHGLAATATRRSLVVRLDAALASGALGGFPAARLALRDSTAPGPALAAEDALREALARSRNRDRAAGGAVEGPHRADFEMFHREKGVPAALCSTGEQKSLLISTVLAHAGLIHAARGFAPLLLLDEIAAHLDADRRAALFAALATLPAQAWLTGTDADVFAPLRGVAQGFIITPGEITKNPDLPLP